VTRNASVSSVWSALYICNHGLFDWNLLRRNHGPNNRRTFIRCRVFYAVAFPLFSADLNATSGNRTERVGPYMRSVSILLFIYVLILGFLTVFSVSCFSEWMFNAFDFFYDMRPAQPFKVSCAGILSSACYGNTALPQCMLCVNRPTASCWIDCTQP
jgi:hypothetical protein